MIQSHGKTFWQFLKKTKHILSIRFSNHTTYYLLQQTENLYLHKNLHMEVYSSFIFIITQT